MRSWAEPRLQPRWSSCANRTLRSSGVAFASCACGRAWLMHPGFRRSVGLKGLSASTARHSCLR
jgi:hypothetical protein